MKRCCTQMRDKTAFLEGTDWCYAILQIKMLWHMGHKHHPSSDLYQQEGAVWESEVCILKLWCFFFILEDWPVASLWNSFGCVLYFGQPADLCLFVLKFGHLCFYQISWSNWIPLLKLMSLVNICLRLKGELGRPRGHHPRRTRTAGSLCKHSFCVWKF